MKKILKKLKILLKTKDTLKHLWSTEKESLLPGAGK